jgi:hypothetical protein
VKKRAITDIIEFIRDSGRWGLTSGLAALVSLSISLYEHGRGSTITSYSFMATSALLFWLGAYISWLKKHRQLEALQAAQRLPQLQLRYSPNVPNALVYSGFSLRADNELEASNVSVCSKETIGDGHVRLALRWEDFGHPIGRNPVPVKVMCGYYKEGTFHPYGGVAAEQINMFFDKKRDNPRELIVTLTYTDMSGHVCPARRFKISQNLWQNREISCEPVAS